MPGLAQCVGATRPGAALRPLAVGVRASYCDPVRLVRWISHPGRVAPAAYLAGWVVGTALLMLPAASRDGRGTGIWEASFTAMSALCITGLAVVDTASHWSTFGQVTILMLIQIGGLGIMTLTSLILFSAARNLTVAHVLIAQVETRARSFLGIRTIPARIVTMALVSQAVIAIILTLRFRAYEEGWGAAAYDGVFHAISAYNNAGFALFPDNLIRFNADPWIMLPICLAVVAGGLGYPVYFEIGVRLRQRGRRFWSVHLRLTLIGTGILLVVGFVTFAVFEWGNPATLGPQPWAGKILGAIGGAVFPRTAGFNSVDYGLVADETIAINFGLMMIGGGSGGTAGGLKVTTVAVLILAVITEVRGEEKTVFSNRKVSSAASRQALAVTALGTAAVFTGLLVISAVSDAPLREDTFEAISAFGTVGLSMNLTPALPHAAWGVLMLLMFLGRVGPVSVAAALAMSTRHRRFELPREDPLVG